jgi:hypothetical protein
VRHRKLLRPARDRMDHEYAQPLDVEALAPGVDMSPGHLSAGSGSSMANRRTGI